MKIKNIEKRGNRKEGVNLIIEVLEKDVIPKGNRKLLNRRNFARTSQTPGKTRTINFYLINNEFYFVDLPGYGYAKVAKSEKD